MSANRSQLTLWKQCGSKYFLDKNTRSAWVSYSESTSVDWGTPQDQQISQILSSSWLVGAVLEQPRLSLMRAWLDAAEQSWAQSTVLLVAAVSLIVQWHVSVVSLNAERSKILESLYKSGTSRIFSSLLCQLCYKRRSCHIRKDALQLSQLPPQVVQWGTAASPPWPNLAQFQKSLPLLGLFILTKEFQNTTEESEKFYFSLQNWLPNYLETCLGPCKDKSYMSGHLHWQAFL